MATDEMRVLTASRRKPIARKKWPEDYLKTIVKMMSRPYNIADIPPALGVSVDSFNQMRKNDDGKINHAISVGRARLHEELVGPLYEQAKAGDTELAKWMLARFFDQYNINARRQVEAGNVDNRIVNIVQIPESMDTDQYAKLLEAMQQQPRVIEHDEV